MGGQIKNKSGELMRIAVAKDIAEQVRKGQKAVVSKTMLKHGYSKKYSEQATRITSKPDYQAIVQKALDEMHSVRGKMLSALNSRDLTKEKTPVLLSGVDVLTRNSRLISGQSTENVGLSVMLQQAEQAEAEEKRDESK